LQYILRSIAKSLFVSNNNEYMSGKQTAFESMPGKGGGFVALRLVEYPEDSWQQEANCLDADPDLFFPDQHHTAEEAKEICRDCVVREECLEYALANGEKFGIWGGLGERERRRVRRQRALASRAIGSVNS
jgi:WhiB family redox-sensing transcriptional regulator